MAQHFSSVVQMMNNIRSNLLGKTFPHLLTHLATATKTKIDGRLFEVAVKHRSRPLIMNMSVSTIPIPGHASVRAVFTAAEVATDEHRAIAEADECKDAVRRFYEDNLSSKELLIRLLNSVGVM